MAADREANEGLGNDIKSNMAANRVLMFRFKTAQYLGKNSLDFLCISQRFNAQNAASTVAHKTAGKSPERSNLSQTEEVPRNEENKRKFRIRPKAERLEIDKVDWPSFYSTASSYNSWLVPLPLRMGRSRHNKVGGLPPRDMGNIELLKIPNFFHLTPPAIERHCEALKDLCTPWPKEHMHRPVRIITRNYLFAGPSLRHPKSHIVQLKVCLKDLALDDHARKKMIELAGHRYNDKSDELTIVADRCPTRKQNRDYAMYLLNVLYHESWKTEPWELEAEPVSEESEIPVTKPSKRRRRRYKIIGNELYRLNKYGKAFKVYVKQHGDRFPYVS